MDIFVYGTLQSTALMQVVAGGCIDAPIAARLAGFALHGVKDDVVPCLQADPDAATDGVIFPGLNPAQMNRIDLYEKAFGYQLTAVEAETEAGPRPVQVYLPSADASKAEGQWYLTDWQRDHETPAVLAAKELFAHDPLPNPAALRAMWPMIEARAWAKTRVVNAPATIRYSAQSDDVQVHKMRPPMGHFFRMQSMDVTHRQFSGVEPDLMQREVFVGVDAAIVLPYDPVRDKVLFVEQARMGPVVRQDPNPWVLEAVAGIVDARETPEMAAHREAVEEANVTLRHLEHAGSYYPSPGASTDYFYTYVGLCDLPMIDSYFGGLPGEHEDLRIHPVGFDAAIGLTQSGEITAGPLFHLLYWLGWHRDRLRAMV